MAGYTELEILNEVSRIFRARLDPGKDGGTLNTREEYSQLIEFAAATFLLNPDAVFYLALLVKNRLSYLVQQEVNLAEDMMVALQDLSQIGSAVVDTTTVSNSITAMLALDAASSVSNRPETTRFKNLMDKLSEQYRPNVISGTGSFVRPRDESRGIIRTNLSRMKSVHATLLTSVFALRDLLEDYLSLDIPSRVANTAFTSIRENLNQLSDDMEDQSETENIASSRRNLLTSLASKSVVNLISSVSDPREVKVRSPLNPIPSTLKHYGRITGEGTPASVITNSGPWDIPVADLTLKIDGGSAYGVSVGSVLGALLVGGNKEPFTFTPGENDYLHVAVDTSVYEGTVSSGASTEVQLSEFFELGFKHLGSPVLFPEVVTAANYGINPNPDLYHRYITEMRLLQNATVVWTGNAGSLSGFTAGDEGVPWLGLQSWHLGGYIVSGGRRYEIAEVVSTTDVVVRIPTGTPSPVDGAVEIRGQSNVATPAGTRFWFNPALVNDVANGSAQIGPTVKTAQLSGTTVADVVSAINAENGSFLSEYDALNRHMIAETYVGDPERLALYVQNTLDPRAKVYTRFPRVEAASPLQFTEDSAHKVLGFQAGQEDSAYVVTPDELVARILDDVPNAAAEVVETEIHTGDDLGTVDNTSNVIGSVNFDSLVEPNDQIAILNGQYRGVYRIASSSGSTLTLSGFSFESSEHGLSYRVFREQVKISSTRTDSLSSVEVVSAHSGLGLSAGKVVGSHNRFEAVNREGVKLKFSSIIEGDFLRLIGSSEEHEIAEVDGTTLVLSSTLPSTTEKAGFEISSGTARSYSSLSEKLTTYTTSRVLLKKHKFDESLDTLDSVLTSALLPGQNFASSRNRAMQVLADLISLLTDNPQRTSEYSREIPDSAMNLTSILQSYTTPVIVALDQLIDTFLDRKYERAINLLQSGRVSDFFGTNEETGSFGGAVMSASRSVFNDLPTSATQASVVEEELNIVEAVELNGLDPDTDFSDTEGFPDEIGE